VNLQFANREKSQANSLKCVLNAEMHASWRAARHPLRARHSSQSDSLRSGRHGRCRERSDRGSSLSALHPANDSPPWCACFPCVPRSRNGTLTARVVRPPVAPRARLAGVLRVADDLTLRPASHAVRCAEGPRTRINSARACRTPERTSCIVSWYAEATHFPFNLRQQDQLNGIETQTMRGPSSTRKDSTTVILRDFFWAILSVCGALSFWPFPFFRFDRLRTSSRREVDASACQPARYARHTPAGRTGCHATCSARRLIVGGRSAPRKVSVKTKKTKGPK
jgi:hypothetical protein